MIPIVFGQKGITGSYVAGHRDTMEMLAFAAANHIQPRVQVMSFEKINEAMQLIRQNLVRYRIVLKKWKKRHAKSNVTMLTDN